MAKKVTLTAGFITKSNFQSLPTVPADQKVNAATEWNSSIGSLQSSIDENYERLILNWDSDIIDEYVFEVGQYLDIGNITYRVITSYNVGTPKTYIPGNFQQLGASGGSAHVIEDEGTPLAQRSALNFVGSGVTAADTGGKTVVTIPIADDTTKLSKTLSPDQTVASPVTFEGQATANTDTIKTFTATPEFDFDDGNDWQMTLTGNVTSFTTTSEKGSANYKVYLINDGTAGRTVAAPTGWTADTTSETHTDAANAINLYQFYTLPDGSKYFNLHIVKA